MEKKHSKPSNTKMRALSGLMWRFMERFGAQGVTFVVSVVLARLLNPSVYGTIAIVTIFITILNVFIDSGLGNALIQKEEADDLDFSTVFFFNIVLCLVLYIALFLAAPIIADFYHMPDLTKVLRVMSLTVIVSGVKNVQQAYVSRNLLFKRFFYSTLGGTLGAAVLGIWMAYRGYGVWALVMQNLFNTTVDTMILWITVKWRPKRMFSLKRFQSLFSFGWKLLVSSLIDTFYNNFRQLIIGKLYSADSLAYYNRGYMIPNVFVGNINAAIDSVLFPVLSGEQSDRCVVLNMTRRSIQISSFVMWPIMLGLAACSRSIVLLLLTEKWLPAVPYVMIFCFSYTLLPVQSANLNAIKALGYSDIYLKLDIYKKTVGIIVLLITMWHGPLLMAASNLLISLINQIINSWPNRKLLGYSYREQLFDILPSAIVSMIMFTAVWSIQRIIANPIILLPVQVAVGIVIYITGSMAVHNESVYYIWNTLREILISWKVKNQ